MNGQWIGTFSGSYEGTIIVNIDERELCYQGVAYLQPDNGTLPSSAAFLRTEDKARNFHVRTLSINAIDPSTGNVVGWDTIRGRYPPENTFAQYADVTGSWNGASLSLSWNTDNGVTCQCVLPRSRAGEPSELVAEEKDWATYKEYVQSLAPRRFLFRGQNSQYRLRTSFHRSGRADLHRFMNEDIPILYRHLSARTKHLFNLQIPDQAGAFYNLAQHHGYPTPLLDWTYSPYVAAFFAYRGISNSIAARAGPGENVRIIIFDQAQWRADWSQILLVIVPRPHVSIGEFLAVENERMIPQQAASTLTNVDDIESYIRSKEGDGKKYLWAVDLPMGERQRVFRELGYMGITAGSLFPGLDGACEELKERNFDA
jgi:hypothetical protein